MGTFLIVMLWFLVVLPWLFKRMCPPVTVATIEPPPPTMTVFTPSIVIHVRLAFLRTTASTAAFASPLAPLRGRSVRI
jgi:hypothetical protein